MNEEQIKEEGRKYGREQSEKNAVTLAEMARDIRYIQDDLKEIKSKIEGNFITKSEFEPVKRIVYGMVGLILVAVIGALLTLILK